MFTTTQTTNATKNRTTALQDTVWWIRVVLGVELCLTDALRHILHNYDNDPLYTGLTDDEVQLYNEMLFFKKSHKKKLRNIIHEEQWNILCPSSGCSDSSSWDITLLIIVIRYCTNLPAPLGGWDQKVPHFIDITKAAFVLRSRKFRNDVKHGSVHDISTKSQFTIFWGDMETLLKGLNYTNMSLFYDLETGTLKMYTKQILKALEERIADVEDHNDNEDNEIKTLKTHLSLLQTSQTKNDEFHKIFTSDLKRLGTEVQALKLKKALPLPTGIYWNIYENIHNFMERKDAFTKIENTFVTSNETYDHVTVVIHGIGGVGKTELAANYAKVHKKKSSYDNIIWLDCENIHDSIKEFFTSYCSNNGQSSVTAYLNAIYTTLKDTKCLFILDNIEKCSDTDVFFKNVGCFTFKPNFLITTQRVSWDHCKFQAIELLVFSKEESFSFIKDAFPTERQESIAELVAVLNCFPLALALARAYIQKHKISIHNYVEYFRVHNEKILAVNLQNFGSSQYSKTLLTVWNLAFQKIKSDEKSLAILGIMTFMDNKRINKNTFLFHQLINQDEVKLNEVIDILTEYSLVQIRNTAKYTILCMHTLVQKMLLCNVLPNVLDHFAETIALFKIIILATEFTDTNNIWYVHLKFILMQVLAIDNENILLLSIAVLKLAFTRIDSYVSTHITNLLTNIPAWFKEKVDASTIIMSISAVCISLLNEMKLEVCEHLLSEGVRILESYPISRMATITWHLVCLSYYLDINDVMGIQQNYNKIKDFTPFPAYVDVEAIPWYLLKLKIIKQDYGRNRVLIKTKAEWLNVINEPINILRPFFDTYGYEKNSLASLYFYCVLWKIEVEINNGEDEEEEILVVKEKLKHNYTLTNRFDNFLVDLQVLNCHNLGKFKKGLEILCQYKNDLVRENQNSSAFIDNGYNVDILRIDYNISISMLKLEMYKEADEVLTNLRNHEKVAMNFNCSDLILYTIIAKTMCKDMDSANDLINQIPMQALSKRGNAYTDLRNYMNDFLLKNQEFKDMKERSGSDHKDILKRLLNECVHLRKNIATLCIYIISKLQIKKEEC